MAFRGNASFLQLLKDPIRFFRMIDQRQGPIAEIKLGLRRFFLVSDTDLIRELLMTQSAAFEKFPQIDPDRGFFGRGLLTSEGAAHRVQRRMLQPGFHRDRIRFYADQMVASTLRLTESWADKGVIDASAAMNELALDIVARTLFSVQHFNVAHDIAHQIEVMMPMVNQFVMPWGDLILHLPLPASFRYKRAYRKLDEIVYGMIEQTRQSAEPADDLLKLLLAATQLESEDSLTAREIRDEVVTMFVAGHETVAMGLTWCLYLLAAHPEIQEQLRLAVNDTLGTRKAEASDFESLAAVEHAFAESMRLYPPIWILGRRALHSFSFGDISAPKGAVFLVCMAALHRSSEFFDNPEEYIPERWANITWPPYAYIPFGGGLRRCIGERFAWMEAVLCLATMLQQWTFSLEPNEPAPETAPSLTLRTKKPVMLRVERQTRSVVDEKLRCVGI